MECWLYKILKNTVDDKTLKFLECHKKDIRFTFFDGFGVQFEVKNVGLHITYPKTIHRISNIKIVAACCI